MRAAKLFTGWWLILLVVYLLLVGRLALEEIAAGLVAAALAAAALTVVRVQSGWNFSFPPGWLAALSRAVADAFRGCVIMLKAICERPAKRRSGGRIEEINFDPGNDIPACRARRSLVIAAVSLAPDGFVLGVNRQRHKLVLHRYGKSGAAPASKEWPL